MGRSRTPSIVAAAATALALAAVSTAGAQVPGVLGIELRAGAAAGAFEPTGVGLEVVPGPAWGLAVTWGPADAIAAYASYASIGFGCTGGFCRGYDVTFVSRGLSLGARAEAPVGGRPWLRAGVLLHDFGQRSGGTGPPVSVDTETDPGFEAAAGLTWRFGRRLALLPGLHMGFLPTRAQDGETDRAFFTSLELGARMRF
jgi:hypothetical protein